MQKKISLVLLGVLLMFLAGCSETTMEESLIIVEFIDYDGTVLQTEDYDIGTDLSGVSAPPDPSREGYTFDAWDKTVPATMGKEKVTVTAIYTINQYTVEYVDYDGTVLQTEDYDFGADLSGISAPPDPSREGYTFDAWDTIVPATMGTEKITVTAIYTEIEKVTLSTADEFLNYFDVSFEQLYAPPSGANPVGTVTVVMTITKKSDFILIGSHQMNLVYYAVNNNTNNRDYYNLFNSDSMYVVSFNIFEFDDSLSYSFTTNFGTMIYTGTEADGFTNLPIFYDYAIRLS